MSRRKSDPPDSGEKIVHEYDGILEADNDLPNWWLAILYTSIAFGAVYWLAAESFKFTPSPKTEFDDEVAKVRALEAKKMMAAGAVTDDSLKNLAVDARSVEEGKSTFVSTCAACHSATAGGGIGPNLTDEFWMHGGTPTKVYGSIKEGFTAKGMPAWGASLGEERVRLVTAYVLSLRNTNVPGGKAAQGDKDL